MKAVRFSLYFVSCLDAGTGSGGGTHRLRKHHHHGSAIHHDRRPRRQHDYGPGSGTTAAPSSEMLIIGDIQGLTGLAGPGEVPAADAMKMVVQQMNDAGGIAGHQIKLIQKDMKSDPTLSVPVTEEVLAAGAQIIIGPAFPGDAAGVVQTAAKKGVAVISLTGTTPGVTTAGGTKAYMVAFGDNAQAAACAEYAIKKGAKTAYLLGSPDSEYTNGLPIYFGDAFEQVWRPGHRQRHLLDRATGLRRSGHQTRSAQPSARLHLHRHDGPRHRHLHEGAARRRRQVLGPGQ